MSELVLFGLMVLGGIVVLLYGGDLLVRGATALARRAGVPPLLVGLTIVAFGTSAPEMVVSVAAAVEGAPGLAIGNIVGSNIANVLLVLGLPALLAPMASNAPGLMRNTVIALAMTAGFIALTFDGGLSLNDGLILAAGIGLYIVYLAISARRSQDDPMLAELTDIDDMDGLPGKGGRIALFLIAGLVLLPAGAQLIVSGGTGIAETFGVSEAVIGLTILAFGTSLPELATAIVAATRRQADMAIGNVVGSNIFNICAVGGITGVSAGLISGQAVPIDPEFLRFDFWVMAGAALAVTLYAITRRSIGRLSGAVLFLSYIAYLGALAAMNLPVSAA